jgi:trimeric autotransporter adhesin
MIMLISLLAYVDIQFYDYRTFKLSFSAIGIITTIAGDGDADYSGDGGKATSAGLRTPHGVAVDALGNVYIADTYNHCIRKVTKSTGVITTVAGTGSYGFDGDGGKATSTGIYQPLAVAVDKSGNIYFLTSESFCIRLVTVTTGVITTVAGECISPAAYRGDGGPATSARLSYPQGVAVDASGNIYIADKSNNCIRMVTKSTGVITTVAGGGDSARIGDGGQATTAYVELPYGVAVDASENIYISEPYQHRIRKVIKSTGVITTVAGNGRSGFSGDGGLATSATFNYPYGVAVDASGSIYVAEESGNRIRMITQSTGVITTVAGNGDPSFSGDGGLATSASLNFPRNVAVDASGNVYIGDTYNNRIRMLTANELTTPSPASVPTLTSAPSAVPISTLSPSTVRISTSAPSAVPISTLSPSTIRISTSAPSTIRTPTLSPSAVLTSTSALSAVPISTSAPSAVLTSTASPFAVLTPTPSPSAVLTSTASPFAVLTPTPSPSAVLTSTSAPFAVPISTAAPSAVPISTSAPSAVLTSTASPFAVLTPTSAPSPILTSTSAPSTTPATSLIATTPTASSTALSSNVLPGVIGGVGGVLIILLVVAVTCFCRRR